MDSAAACGAMAKGRSASRALNERCRRHAAILLGGGLGAFYPWLASGENPADRPSRWFREDGSRVAVSGRERGREDRLRDRAGEGRLREAEEEEDAGGEEAAEAAGSPRVRLLVAGFAGPEGRRAEMTLRAALAEAGLTSGEVLTIPEGRGERRIGERRREQSPTSRALTTVEDGVVDGLLLLVGRGKWAAAGASEGRASQTASLQYLRLARRAVERGPPCGC